MTAEVELTEEVKQHLWKRRTDILYRIELSVCYHRKRERFFDSLDKFAKAIAVIGGSAAFANLGGDDWLPWIAATVTITSTLSLVIGFAEKSRRHSELANRFGMLASSVVAKGDRGYVEDNLNEWEARTREIEASEPPTLGTLVQICEAELYTARGQPYELPSLGKRLLGHFVGFPKPPPKPAPRS
jgi:hypothetical protein